jgi:hypothetical protein
MAQPDRELGEFLRWSLRATAESVAVGEDGLDKIWTRLAAARPSAATGSGIRQRITDLARRSAMAERSLAQR